MCMLKYSLRDRHSQQCRPRHDQMKEGLKVRNYILRSIMVREIRIVSTFSKLNRKSVCLFVYVDLRTFCLLGGVGFRYRALTKLPPNPAESCTSW